MSLMIRDAKVYIGSQFVDRDLIIADDNIFAIDKQNQEYVLHLDHGKLFEKKTNIINNSNPRVIYLDNSFVLPSFSDVHVHFRQPGYEYKETIKTGSMAAAKGGYTSVCTMPNLKPAPSNLEALNVQLDIIKRDSVIDIIPYGSITKDQSGRGTLSDMESLRDYVIAYTDDGFGLQKTELMREAMIKAKELGKLIVAHCEDESLLAKGDIRGSEWKQIERDIKLCDEIGCSYHVCHISTKESVELIRDAKKSGVDISCETAPHYLLLNREMIISDTGKFKMNPPIKDKEDQMALIEGLNDGTIEIIATDHAPHSHEEKSRGYERSLNGIVGLEVAFPMLYTKLVRPGKVSFDVLIRAMSENPRKRFDIDDQGLVILDLNREYKINSDEFLSKGKSTPFDGELVNGETVMTILRGEIVYEKR